MFSATFPNRYVSNVSTFSHTFPLVLNSNLHDLNETNPGLTLCSAELPSCCSFAEIKVLGMERNFARIFYINNKNFWSQDPPERGPWLGTTHQGAPPSPGAPRWVVPTWWPCRRPPDTIKSHISRRKKIREKELSRSTRWSRHQALFFLGRADLESVWGSGEGDLRSSSSPNFLHR